MVRLTDRPDMTLDVYRGRKTTIQLQYNKGPLNPKQPTNQPTTTYCKRRRPLPYHLPNCRVPRHWKFTKGYRITRPPTFGTLNVYMSERYKKIKPRFLVILRLGPLRQYVSLYRAVFQRERKKRQKLDERKISKQIPSAPIASAIGTCPAFISK